MRVNFFLLSTKYYALCDKNKSIAILLESFFDCFGGWLRIRVEGCAVSQPTHEFNMNRSV